MASNTCSAETFEELLQLQANQELVMAALLDLQTVDVCNNQELSDLFDNYNAITLKTQAFSAALQQHLNAISKYQSLVHEALYKQEQEDNGEATFGGHPLIADELFQDLARVYRQDLLMHERLLQSLNNNLLEKVDCIDVWKKVCAVFFTAAAAISVPAAASKANSNTAAAAAASAASVLFGAVGKWIHSVLKKRESALKKPKDIIGVMIRGARSSIKDLTNIHVLGGRLQYEAKSVLKMVDDDGVMEVDVRKKVEELNNIFQELRGKANDYGRNMNRATEAVLQSIITRSE